MTDRNRYLTAAGTTLGVFLMYLATLSPSVAMWDAGEYIASASALGIPHQPGNPLFVLMAHVAGLIPVSPSYAARINVLAALASAVSAGLWFLCAERLMRPMIESAWLRAVAAVTASLLGATAFTVWNQSVVMEKVYPLALVGLALVSWLMIVWLDTQDVRRGDRLLVLCGYVMGLTYAIHPAGLLTGPACALAVLRTRPAMIKRWGLIGVILAAFFVGASPFAMMPIRAAHQPFQGKTAGHRRFGTLTPKARRQRAAQPPEPGTPRYLSSTRFRHVTSLTRRDLCRPFCCKAAAKRSRIGRRPRGHYTLLLLGHVVL